MPLIGAYCTAGCRADLAIHCADVKPGSVQALLQGAAFSKAQVAIASGPLHRQRSHAAHPVAKVPHADDIGLRVVVAADHVIVSEHQKCGSTPAGWCNQRRAAIVWHGAAICPDDPKVRPLRGAAGHGAARIGIVKAARQADFDAPGLPFAPPKTAEVVRGRGQRIAWVVGPDVAASVACEVHSIGLIAGWYELGMPHRPGPTAGHIAGRDITALQNLERCNQLLFEKAAASAVKGQRGEGGNQGGIAAPLTIVAFHAPNRDDDVPVNVEARLNPAEKWGQLGLQGPAIADPNIAGRGRHIFRHRFDEFSLIAVPFDAVWQIPGPCESGIKGAGADPLRQGTAAEPLHPTGKTIGLGRQKAGAGKKRQGKGTTGNHSKQTISSRYASTYPLRSVGQAKLVAVGMFLPSPWGACRWQIAWLDHMIGWRKTAEDMKYPFASEKVAAAFAAFDPKIQDGLLHLRDLIFDIAATIPAVGPVSEELRWGQPAYLTPKTKAASTLRLGTIGPDIAIFAHCQSSIISDFAATFGTLDRIEGNRAVLFGDKDQIDDQRIATLIRHGLTYHL